MRNLKNSSVGNNLRFNATISTWFSYSHARKLYIIFDDRGFPVEESCVYSCWLILFLFSVFLLVIPGPIFGPAWTGLVLSGGAWSFLVLSAYLTCRIFLVLLSRIQQRPAANSRWPG
jgi:hypothetical protein